MESRYCHLAGRYLFGGRCQCGATGGWRIEAFDAAEQSLGSATTAQALNSPYPQTEFRPTQLTLRGHSIRRVDLQCTYRLAVLAVVAREGATGTEQTDIRTSLRQMLDRYKVPEPVLDPNRRYKLVVSTTVEETSGKSLSGAQVEKRAASQHQISGSMCTFTDEFFFRTEGPPGDTALTPTAASPDSAPPLDTLDAYVRELLPPRGAPAVYRSYDVRVGFDADYVAQMYISNGQTLEIELRSADGAILAVASNMAPGRQLVLRREEREWLSTLDRSSCYLTLASSATVHESTVDAQLVGSAPLRPRTRYDATLRGKQPGKTEGARPLAQWSFVSSAFADFADHFRLTGKVRTAPLTVPGSAQWLAQTAAQLAAGDPFQATGDERARRREIEIQAFEALIAQLNIEPSLPSALELTAVVDGTTTCAMLLSSPEPFDWERVQLALTRKEPIVVEGGCLSALFGYFRPPTLQMTDVQQPVAVVRDADGTRAFLIAQTGAAAVAFTPTVYSLSGTFKRDAGPALPVLTKGGSAADEQATITWTLTA